MKIGAKSEAYLGGAIDSTKPLICRDLIHPLGFH
jgi:hypothetical protein